MSELMNVDELMALCIDKLPEKEIKLSNGKSVRVRALKGSVTSTIFSKEDMGEKIFDSLREGLIEPKLNTRQLQKFIDFSPDNALEIFTNILELSNAMGDIEEKKVKEIKKNS